MEGVMRRRREEGELAEEKRWRVVRRRRGMEGEWRRRRDGG